MEASTVNGRISESVGPNDAFATMPVFRLGICDVRKHR